MDLEKFEVNVTATKKNADELYSILSNHNQDFMYIPAIPVSAMKDFLDDKRENVWEVTLNDKVYLVFEAEREAVLALIKMVKGAGEEEFPVAPLPIGNLRAFVNGQRETVAHLEIRRNKDVQVRVKPEKEKEKEEKKTESKKEDK